MRIALLGCDNLVIELAHASVRAGDTIVAVFDIDGTAGEWPQTSEIRPGEGWETLLLGTLADVVFVASGDFSERRADQLRKLVQAAVPLVLVSPACEAIVGFELDMIQRDTRCVMIPFIPGAEHPAMELLRQWRDDPACSPTGPIEQVVVERRLSDRSRGAVLAQLGRDVQLIRQLIGPITKVGALGGGGNDAERMASLNVHMSTAGGPLARWSVGPTPGAPSGQLIVSGARGQAILEMPAGKPWTLAGPADGAPVRSFDVGGDAEVVLSRLRRCLAERRAVEGEQRETRFASPEGAHRTGAGVSWNDACRDLEVAETAERSAKRGKTIELFNEEHTEEATFKSLMAAGGCLLLFGCLLFVTILAFGAGAPTPISGSPVWRVGSLLLCGMLGLFTLLQLLILVFRGTPRQPNSPATANGESQAPRDSSRGNV